MKRLRFALRISAVGTLAAAAVLSHSAFAQEGGAAPVALTIYNQNFAVARTTVDLNLKAGANEVTTTNVTSQLEPDSVVLRDPAGKVVFKVTEQNYDAGVIDQNSLLEKFEGKTIQFSRGQTADGKPITVDGKIIRAGTPGTQPLVEADGADAVQSAGHSAVSGGNGRAAAEADAPLADRCAAGRASGRRAGVYHQRHELAGDVQRGRAGIEGRDWSGARGSVWLGDHAEQQRHGFSPGADQADGRGCGEDPEPARAHRNGADMRWPWTRSLPRCATPGDAAGVRRFSSVRLESHGFAQRGRDQAGGVSGSE